jgi:hypothetical protein
MSRLTDDYVYAGDPLGLGIKGDDGVWRRNFTSGTAVWFDGATSFSQICWGGKGPGGTPCPQFVVPPPAPSPPPPAPQPPIPSSCGTIKLNTGVGGTGSDLKSLQKRVETAADCCAWCEAHQGTSVDPEVGGGCVFWAWHDEQGGACHLHTVHGEFTRKDGCYSGRLANGTTV